jgi:hypothetical protein
MRGDEIMKYLVWNGRTGKALGRSSISAPLGWTFEQHAYCFDTPEQARQAAQLAGVIAGFEILGVNTLSDLRERSEA